MTYLAGSDIGNKRVAVPRDGGDALLARRIEALGAEVVDVPVYQWGPPEDPGPARRLMQSVVDGRSRRADLHLQLCGRHGLRPGPRCG